ncbi:MAG: NlpC/P60 family protein [Bacteroidales bacterium]|nr:NlpC/P60 family protein [Bacteroidales bacterium]
MKKMLITLSTVMATMPLLAQDNPVGTSENKAYVEEYAVKSHCPTIDSIVNYAYQKIPIARYKYGAAGPDFFDCSGFVYHCYGKFGITLPRSSSEQILLGKKIEREDIRVGDLVFFSRNNHSVGHVGIVVESDIDADHNFRFIHAENFNTGIRVDHSAAPGYVNRYKGARRILDCDAAGKSLVLPNDTIFIDTLELSSEFVQQELEKVEKTAQVLSKPAQPSSTIKYHKVKKGETLSSISRKYHTTVANLKKWNKLRSDLIREGQRLIVHK